LKKQSICTIISQATLSD